MYKAIIFDLDNTLLNFNLSEQTAMEQAIASHHLQDGWEWESFWATFRPINFKYWLGRIESNSSIEQVLEHSFIDTFTSLNLDTSLCNPLIETYWEMFCNRCDLEPGAEQILEDLKETYTLAVITNGIGVAQRKRLEAGNLHHYFDALIISDEVGYWKPDLQIFQTALQQLSLNTDEVLFVGDSLNDDYLGAVNAGIDFCYYNRSGADLEPHHKPKYMVKQLGEIVGYLQKMHA
ncbi:HAD family hydrolase [Paenibacillus sp. 481]|uniref:HAD family hydrolase n=1 Tax=Paenibacillus sp. 481 TaxID=2835869 RepID=UPI001E3624B5|nr:HAD family hydrolase [Paenibacillus sp. 481]